MLSEPYTQCQLKNKISVDDGGRKDPPAFVFLSRSLGSLQRGDSLKYCMKPEGSGRMHVVWKTLRASLAASFARPW